MTSRPPTRLRAQPRPQVGEDNTTGQLRGLTRARPQAGEDNTTGQLRGALTGLLRARPLAGEQA